MATDPRRLQKPRIRDFRSGDPCELAHSVCFSFAHPENVTDRNTVRQNRISEQLAVALPPNRLSAHHRGRAVLRKREQILDTATELRGLHVIGVSAEAWMLPRGVYGIESWFSQSAQ